MSTKLIEKYSQTLRNSMPVAMEEDVDVNTSDPLDPYRECQSKGAPFDVLFSFVAPNGDLSLRDTAGITIVLRADVISNDLPYYDERTKSIFLGSPFTVKVQSIDEDNNTVYVRSGRDHRNAVKSRLKRELIGELKEGNEPIVVGKVISVNKVRAEVDLMGKGIRGLCNVRDWSVGFVRDMRDVCKKGDILEFKVFSKIDGKKGPQRFLLSRKTISQDPWELIPKEYLTKDAELVVKCVDRPRGMTYWWGTSPFVPEIEIMADYTKRFTHETVTVGISYKCKVFRADAVNHKFQVVPYDVADADVNTDKAVRFYKSKVKENKK